MSIQPQPIQPLGHLIQSPLLCPDHSWGKAFLTLEPSAATLLPRPLPQERGDYGLLAIH